MYIERSETPNRTIENYSIIRNGNKHVYLKSVASDIWTMLNGNYTVASLRDRLVTRYPNKADEVDYAMTSLLNYLSKKNLLKSKVQLDGVPKPMNAESRVSKNGVRNEIDEIYYNKKYILKADLEITYDCNLDCKHCYNMPGRGTELTTAEWRNVMDQLAEMGCINLAFTGGEVLRRDDFIELLEYACKKEFSIRIKTNGALIDRQIARIFRSCRPYLLDVEISYYGTTPETHDSFTQRPGSFNNSCQAVHYLRQEGIYVIGKYLIMKQNLHECRSIESLSKELDFRITVSSGALIPRVNRDRSPLDFMISNDEQKVLFKAMTEYSIPFPSQSKCDPAKTRCSISPEGNVCSCEWLADISFGNIRNESLKKIWLESPKILEFRALASGNSEECIGCAVSKYCGRCPATAYLETGKVNGKSPVSCRVAYICSEVEKELA